MSKMKHLLRKLHIGGALSDQPPHGLPETRPRPLVATSNPSPNSNPSPSSSSDSITAAMGRIAAVEPAVDRTAGVAVGVADGSECVDFNFLEEEFQVQLALAISASDPDAREVREDPESAQIDAAKRMSLGCSGSVADSEALLSLQYWSYNVVNYDEKVMDGFYDVYGVTSNSATQGKMPLLVDLQAISILDNVNYDVILVNRLVDPELQKLEREAYTVSMECRYSQHGVSGLIQKVADMVVNRLGGPVGDADEMLKRWSMRRSKLRHSLNSIVLPLGRLDVGLSRHRALLFKVLADRINLPCMLVKGSYYTGTDDGAVNLIKMGNGSEYIIDLMGAPGALIPAEVPSSHLLNSGPEIRSFADVIETAEGCLVPEKGADMLAVSSNLDQVSESGNVVAGSASSVGIQRKMDKRNLVEETSTKKFENEFGRLLPALHKSGEGSSGICVKASPAEKMQVKNVSKYVISASKHPEFAQKLHAVLLESGTPQPYDLFPDSNSLDLVKAKYDFDYSTFPQLQPVNLIDYDDEQKQSDESSAENKEELGLNVVRSNFSQPFDTTSEREVAVRRPNGQTITDATCVGDSCQRQFQNDLDMGKKSASNLMETANSGVIECNGRSEKINFGEDAEWEIPWEDLQIGERIGIGSYGEVYHADWNGTEVAVKKFLDQDFSGDSLVQFKCEVEIMLRLRHPNVVLFMGAVTRSPHFSILTEFLPRGSLYRLLHRPNHQLDERRRMRMALDVAKGMNYLHTSHPTIVHRDLKSPNLLVDKNWVVKVCDFGLSRTKHHTFLSSKSTAGTPEWMAPEVLRNEPANEKCDVYSFGVILWELATLQIPWKGLNPMQVVGAVGFQHRRLEIPEHIDPVAAQIIRDCWLTEPHLRPSFSQLMYRLRHLQHLVVERTTASRS